MEKFWTPEPTSSRNHKEMARAAIELVRKHQPLYLDLKYYREDAEKWFADTSIVEQLLQGLRKIGPKDFTDSSKSWRCEGGPTPGGTCISM